jgi:putative endonuclease
MASQRNGTLYTGVTNNLVRRVHEHKEKLVRGFTSWYNVNRLVYHEPYDSPYEAIKREKQLKFWKRDWKIVLIEEKNPYWDDLYPGLLG